MFESRYSEVTRRLAVEDSGAWDVHDRAREMEREGQDVILLCVGDPDFRTPEPIIDNAVSYLRVGRTHYSPALGEMKLRRAVADMETQTSPHPCSAEEVAIFPGATNALHAVMSCLLDPGDEVVIPEPMYVGYGTIMSCLMAKVIAVPLLAERDFALDLTAIKQAVNARTRVVFVNTPGNPTGSIIPRAELAELADFCRQRNVWLVCDEVYSMFSYQGRHRSLRACAAHLDNVVMVDGLSKSHAMSGWRVGWAVAPRELIQRLGNYAAATLFGCPQFIQDASAFALENDQRYVQEMREEYRQRRDLVLSELKKLDSLHCHVPRAGMFIMCDVSGSGLSGRDFSSQLLDAEGVSVVPGDAFGPSAASCVRIGLAQPRHVLGKACQRIQRFCDSL
ncbi:MAG: aminotransferase class I/II-fold pyridoxal phosphate-dependent enzyme [Gammaproteobacteria bacterium]|nr:aminotransferase class I/II-fold pyridoxal phosphate-dependent enzyme [Gammaproteobacteria bacterium]